MHYPVAEIFRSLQGEGHFVGYPMVFVRLAGCSVRDCHIRAECDEAPWKMKKQLSDVEIAAEVLKLQRSGIVCITGGEPTDHDLLPLVARLRRIDMRVHMETSGIRSIDGWPVDWLTVSPKRLGTGMGLAQRTGHTLKVVVRPEWSAEAAWGIIEGVDAGTNFFHRYLQPMTLLDGSTNLRTVIEMSMSDRNVNARWALSTQAHRGWGLK